jgi:hypothetical protein
MNSSLVFSVLGRSCPIGTQILLKYIKVGLIWGLESDQDTVCAFYKDSKVRVVLSRSIGLKGSSLKTFVSFDKQMKFMLRTTCICSLSLCIYI